jgi:thiamine-phosphate pyrophosphorylase
MSAWPRGFYAVLDRDDEVLAHALASVASVLQVRLKPASVRHILRVGEMARRVCTEHGIALVINDRVDLALAVGADGVHLGQTDMPLPDARRLAAGRLRIGISTHNAAQVDAAGALAPDYIAFGPVFSTTTKQNPDPTVGLAALRETVRSAGAIPVVAIGGISPHHAGEIYATGVTAICAISAVNGAVDVARAGRALQNGYGNLRGE